MEFYDQKKIREKFFQINLYFFFLTSVFVFCIILFAQKTKTEEEIYEKAKNLLLNNLEEVQKKIAQKWVEEKEKTKKTKEEYLDFLNNLEKVQKETVQEEIKSENSDAYKNLIIPFNEKNNNWMNELFFQEKVKKEIIILLESIKNIPLYQTSLSSSIANHCLFFGPPGSGKSYLAEQLAKNESCGYVFANFETVLYSGSSLKKQKEAFEQAKKILNIEEQASENEKRNSRPFFIIIDEIDSVGTKGSGENHANIQESNGLLKMIDEINREKKNIIIIGITNYPEMLEAALIRSGRLGKKIEFSYPNDEEMKKLMDYFAEKTKNNDWKFFENNEFNNKKIWNEGDENNQKVIKWEDNFWKEVNQELKKKWEEIKDLDFGLSIVDLEQVINECICLGKKDQQKIIPSVFDFKQRLKEMINDKKRINKFEKPK